MPKYSYLAKSLTGTPRPGVLEAKDEHELAKILHQEGYILISAESAEKPHFFKKIVWQLPFLGRKISATEKIMFTRNLKVIIAAGISLPKALNTLAEQSKSKKFKEILLAIAEKISKGEGFSQTLSYYPTIFSELFVAMVKVGEESGTLEQSLDILAQQMEKDYELRAKIKGAMIYPLVIVCAMILIGIFMLIMVIPQLAKTFEELNIELPLTTRIVIALGNFLANFWYTLPFLLLFLVILVRVIVKTNLGKKLFDKLFLKIPIFSSIIKKTNSAYTVRTLGSLISAGIPIVRCLEITSGTLGNIYYKKAMLLAAEEIKKGAKLSQFLAGYQDIYPSLVVQMLAVGEETGQTSDMLSKLADFYEEEVARATKNLSVVIEPLLMIVVGILVGFFVVSMIQPMYSMLQSIK
jgi:type IV pilus assembly protein PilC